jgi:hypothetical protein
MAERQKVIAIVAGSLAVTGLLVTLVFSLGGWAYQHRRFTLHDGRLRRLVEQHPPVDQVTQALLAESGNWTIPTPATEAELRSLAARWPTAHVDDIVAKRKKWKQLLVFGVRDTAYFLYFDEQGKLQDYAIATR